MKRWLALGASLGIACAAAVATAHAQVKNIVVTPTRPAQPAGVDAKQAVKALEAFAKGQAPARADRAAEAMRREAQKRMDELEAIHGKIRRIGSPDPAPVGAAAPARPALPFGANLDAQAVQFRQQYRPALRAEYQRLLTACGPSKDQRRLIAREGEKAVMDAARKVALWQRTPHAVNANGGTPGSPNPRNLIQDALVAAARAHLSPEQAARFKEEVEQRRQDYRRAAVANLVAKFDQNLFLSEDQREKLGDVLLKNWDDSWCQSLQMFIYDQQYFPSIPDRFVTPVLDPTQSKVWQGIPKAQQFFGADSVMFATDDTPLEDAGQDEPPRAAPVPGLLPAAPPRPAPAIRR